MKIFGINNLIIVFLFFSISMITYPSNYIFFYLYRVPYLYYLPVIVYDLYKSGIKYKNPMYVIRYSKIDYFIILMVKRCWIFTLILSFPIIIGGFFSFEILLSYIYLGLIYSILMLIFILIIKKMKVSYALSILLVLYFFWYFNEFLIKSSNPKNVQDFTIANYSLLITSMLIYLIIKNANRNSDIL